MKQQLLTTIALFMFGLASAQESSNQEPADDQVGRPSGIGVIAGFNYAELTHFSGSAMVNYHAGIFARIKTGEVVALQPEFVMSGQGTKINNESSIHLNYLNLSLLGRVSISEKLGLLAGPQLGFLTTARESYNFGETRIDVKDHLKSTDFGGKIGIGYDVDAHSFIQFTYCTSFSRLQKELALDERPTRQSVFQFSVGYQF